MQQVGFKSWWI